MTKQEKERIEKLKEQRDYAIDIVNSIRQELDEMGRKRDTQRFTKIVDLLDEWQRD